MHGADTRGARPATGRDRFLGRVSYEGTFSERSGSYHRAMARAPYVRRNEFEKLVSLAQITPNARVVDVPSGGGYLAPYLPAGVHLVQLDPCFDSTETRDEKRNLHCRIDSLSDWARWGQTADFVLSLAGLHHESDRRKFYLECRRALGPQGKLVIAEVGKGSREAQFLDGFVSEQMGGHQGDYLTDGDLELLSEAGFILELRERHLVPWQANSLEELLEFVRELFAMRAVSEEQLVSAMDRDLGLSVTNDGASLAWCLEYYRLSLALR